MRTEILTDRSSFSGTSRNLYKEEGTEEFVLRPYLMMRPEPGVVTVRDDSRI